MWQNFPLPPESSSVIYIGKGSVLPNIESFGNTGIFDHAYQQLYVSVCYLPCWVGPGDKFKNHVFREMRHQKNGVCFYGIGYWYRSTRLWINLPRD